MTKPGEEADPVAVEEAPSTKSVIPDADAELEALEEAEAAEAAEAGNPPNDEPTDEVEAESEDEPTADDAETKDEPEQTDDEADKAAKSHRQPGAERRIKELTAKHHAERERAEAAELKAKETEALLAEAIPLPAGYLKPDEAKLIRETNEAEAKLESEEAWLTRYVGTGYTDPKNADKSMTPEEVGDRLVEVRRDLKALGPKSQRATEIYNKAHAKMMEHLRLGQKIDEIRARKAAEKQQPAKRKVIAAGPGGSGKAVGRAAVAPVSRPGFNEKRFKANGANGKAAEVELDQL